MKTEITDPATGDGLGLFYDDKPVNNFLFQALMYARRGYKVFPLWPKDKNPITKNGFKDATDDENTIIAWWDKWPEANIGIATGQPSNLVVVDIDGEPGRLSFADMEVQFDDVELDAFRETARVLSGDDGEHIIFQWPGREVKSSVSKLANHIDIRADGGYVVAAPSVHPNGKPYMWVNDKSPLTMPESLLKLIDQLVEPFNPQSVEDIEIVETEEMTAYGAAVLRKEVAVVEQATEGGRNNALNISACAIGNLVPHEIPEADAHEHLMSAASNIGLGHRESESTVRSGLSRGMEEPYIPEKKKLPSSSSPSSLTKTRKGKPKLLNANALLSQEFGYEAVWPIEDLVPCGVTLLFSSPKVGKSYLALQMAMSVASGEPAFDVYPVKEPGDVLYLAMEDNGKRIAERMKAIMGDKHYDLSRLSIYPNDEPWRPLLNGGLDDIKEWIDSVDKPRLIIIDVLQKVRGETGEGGNAYGKEYKEIAPITQLANSTGVNMLLLHHTNKRDATDDPFLAISGTQAIAGSMDTLIYFSKTMSSDNEDKSKMHFRGRDIEDRERYFFFDGNKLTGKLVLNSQEQEDVYEAINRFGPQTITKLAAELDLRIDTARKRLARMENRGQIVKKKGYGTEDLYYVPGTTIAEEGF